MEVAAGSDPLNPLSKPPYYTGLPAGINGVDLNGNGIPDAYEQWAGSYGLQGSRDSDKDGYTEYLDLSLPLLRPGGLLLADNTLPDAVLTGETSGTKRYNAAVAERAELTTVVIPILRQRGIDGLTVSFKRGEA